MKEELFGDSFSIIDCANAIHCHCRDSDLNNHLFNFATGPKPSSNFEMDLLPGMIRAKQGQNPEINMHMSIVDGAERMRTPTTSH